MTKLLHRHRWTDLIPGYARQCDHGRCHIREYM